MSNETPNRPDERSDEEGEPGRIGDPEREPVFAETADENVEAAELIADPDRPTEPAEAPADPTPVAEPAEAPVDRTPVAEPAEAPATVPSASSGTETAAAPATVPSASSGTETAAAPATVPSASSGTETAAATPATTATETGNAAPISVPIYVEAPVRPKRRGNRGFGILIALIGTITFALVYAAVVGIIGGLDTPADRFGNEYLRYLASAPFYIPVIFFFIAMVLLILIVNRASWWVYIIGAFFVGVVVYFSFFGGALLAKQAWQLTPDEAGRFVRTLWLNPFALAGGIVGHEVAIWTGAWLSARGRKLKAKNAQAQAEYDAAIAAGPGYRHSQQSNGHVQQPNGPVQQPTGQTQPQPQGAR